MHSTCCRTLTRWPAPTSMTRLLTIVGDAAHDLPQDGSIPDSVVANVVAGLTYLSREVYDLRSIMIRIIPDRRQPDWSNACCKRRTQHRLPAIQRRPQPRKSPTPTQSPATATPTLTIVPTASASTATPSPPTATQPCSDLHLPRARPCATSTDLKAQAHGEAAWFRNDSREPSCILHASTVAWWTCTEEGGTDWVDCQTFAGVVADVALKPGESVTCNPARHASSTTIAKATRRADAARRHDRLFVSLES